MSDATIESCRESMDKRVKTFENDLTKLRTGRASINLLDGVKVDYYGAPTPLNQVATLTTPDARTITVAPYEKKIIGDIERAIMIADLGVQPTNDGNVVRVPIPALTEERRKDIVKSLKKMAEEAKVALRHIRRDANEGIKKQEKAKEIAEDDSKRLQADIQKETDAFVKMIDERSQKKETEIMTV